MKLRFLSIAVLISAAAMAALGRAANPTITQEELVRRTQAIADATAPGNQEPFKKYFADDVMFFDEKGRSMDKAALVKDVQPLPQGYSGNIKVVNPRSHIEGNVAILSYDMDETEVVYGQEMHARYHQTDTWMRRGGKWQIVASQVLRYYEDPAPGKADISKFPGYAGTYQLGDRKTVIYFENDHLYEQRNGGSKMELIPEAAGIFFRKGIEGRWLFGYGDDGKVVTLIDRRNNEDIVWKKVR